MSDEEDDVPFEYAHPEPVQGHTPMYDDVSEDESHSVEQHDDEDLNVPEYEKLEYPKRPIQVVTRVRPLLKRDVDAGHQPCVAVHDDSHVQIGDKTVLQFDRVFGEDSEQQQIYQICADSLVDGLFEGFNGSILAYGQTGSGKTYTMGSDWFDEMNLNDMGQSFEGESTILQDLQDDQDVEHMSKEEQQSLLRKIHGIQLSNCGVLPRAFLQVAKRIEEYVQGVYLGEEEYPQDVLDKIKLEATFFEIYQEKLYDLLHPEVPTKQISVLDGRQGDVHVRGTSPDVLLDWSRPSNPEATDNRTPLKYTVAYKLLKCLSRGVANRTTSSTSMNDTSSRSHAIFTLSLSGVLRTVDSPDDKGNADIKGSPASNKSRRLTSQLRLVDLAGSERAKRTQATGMRFAESVQINQGLLALGNVIAALAESPERGPMSPELGHGEGGSSRSSSQSRKRSSAPPTRRNKTAPVSNRDESYSSGPEEMGEEIDFEHAGRSGSRKRSHTPLSLVRNTGKGAGAHIPYRDSKLTRLLRDSLGGNSRTCFIACISPCEVDFHESRSTLRYAERARSIKNTPSVGIEPINMREHADQKVRKLQEVPIEKIETPPYPLAPATGEARVIAPDVNFLNYQLRSLLYWIIWKMDQMKESLGGLLSENQRTQLSCFCNLVRSCLEYQHFPSAERARYRRRRSLPVNIRDIHMTGDHTDVYTGIKEDLQGIASPTSPSVSRSFRSRDDNTNSNSIPNYEQAIMKQQREDIRALNKKLDNANKENELLRSALSAAEGSYVRALKGIAEEEELSTSNASSHAANASGDASVIDEELQRSIDAAFATEPKSRSNISDESNAGGRSNGQESNKLREENERLQAQVLELEQAKDDDERERQQREEMFNEAIEELRNNVQKKDQLIQELKENTGSSEYIAQLEKKVERLETELGSTQHSDAKIDDESKFGDTPTSSLQEHMHPHSRRDIIESKDKDSPYESKYEVDERDNDFAFLREENEALRRERDKAIRELQTLEKQFAQYNSVYGLGSDEGNLSRQIPRENDHSILPPTVAREEIEAEQKQPSDSRSQQAKRIWIPIFKRIKEYVRQCHYGEGENALKKKLQSVRAQMESTESEIKKYSSGKRNGNNDAQDEDYEYSPRSNDFLLTLQEELTALQKEEASLQEQLAQLSSSKKAKRDPGNDRSFIEEIFSILGSIPPHVLRPILFQSVVEMARTLSHAKRYKHDSKEAQRQLQHLSEEVDNKSHAYELLQKQMQHREQRWRNKVNRIQAQLNAIENSDVDESRSTVGLSRTTSHSQSQSQKDSLVLNALDLSEEY